MPIKDFTSKGRPRNGQWIWLDGPAGKWLAIVDAADHGLFSTRIDDRRLKGEIEVVRFPSPEERVANRALAHDDANKRHGRPGWYCVSVLEVGSRDTAFHVLVDGERLTPVVDKKELPPAVLATMRPDFLLVP